MSSIDEKKELLADFDEQFKEIYPYTELTRYNVSQLEREIELCKLYQSALTLSYENESPKFQVWLCRQGIKNLLPRYERLLGVYEDDVEGMNELYRQYRGAYAYSARRSMYHFAKFLEWEKPKKVWQKTADTMAAAFKYADRMIADDNMLFYRLSCQPGLGKTYIVNLMVANMFGNNRHLPIIRVSYAEDNVKSSTSQIKAIMSQDGYKEIFPDYEGFGDTSTQYQFNLKGSTEAVNYVGVTRFGQLSGKRGAVMIYDDLLKGELEATNKQLCDQVTQVVIGDAESRADDDKQKTITIGTIRSTFDPMLKQVENFSTKWKPSGEKYVEVTFDSLERINGVSIAIPALDYETDESTCPERYSTSYLRKQRKKLGDSFAALYQQRPKPLEGLGFGWSNLKQYDELPDKEVVKVACFADPPRTGKNYFAMPILYNYGEREWYLVDAMFQRKQSKELIARLVEKINQHKVNTFCYENNVDTTLDELVAENMAQYGGWQCAIDSKYTYENKQTKIMATAPNLKQYIVFPKIDKIVNNRELAAFMEQMTTYSFDYPNKYDDAIDALTMFVNRFVDIEAVSGGGKITPLSIRSLGGRI